MSQHYLQKSLLICIMCEQTVAKKCLVGKHKYSLLKHMMPQIANITNNRRHICNICYIQLQQNFVCVCCSRNVEEKYVPTLYESWLRLFKLCCIMMLTTCKRLWKWTEVHACHVTKDSKRQIMTTLCCHIMVDIQM